MPVGVKGRAGEPVVYDGLDVYVYSLRLFDKFSELNPRRGELPVGGTVDHCQCLISSLDDGQNSRPIVGTPNGECGYWR